MLDISGLFCQVSSCWICSQEGVETSEFYCEVEYCISTYLHIYISTYLHIYISTYPHIHIIYISHIYISTQTNISPCAGAVLRAGVPGPPPAARPRGAVARGGQVPARGGAAAGGRPGHRPRGAHLHRGLVLHMIHRFHNQFSQSQRRPLLGPSPGWKCLLASAFTFKTLLRHYAKWALTQTLC